MRSLIYVTLDVALAATSIVIPCAAEDPPKPHFPKDVPVLVQDCSTKGVINRKGERIYYLANEPAWKKIEIKGHRDREWICGGETAARFKGYQPARYDNVFDE